MFEGGNTVSPPAELLSTAIGMWSWLRNGELPISVFYPNFGIFDDRLQRCVVFHHGQFLEALYHLMSIGRRMAFREKEWLLDDAQVWDIETENFAWIDFVWSTLGRSGAVGKAVDTIYQIFPDKRAREKLIDNLSRELPKHIDIPLVPTSWAERRVFNRVLHEIADRLSHSGRGETGSAREGAIDEMIGAYVNGPLQMQMKGELRGRGLLDGEKLPFDDLTFVYGHTHRPTWYQDVDVASDLELHQVFNTGGWVVNSAETGSRHGATVVVLDEQLDTAAIRVFEDRGKDDDYSAAVQGRGPLKEAVQERLYRGSGAWNKLGQDIKHGSERRRAHIKEILDRWSR